VTLRWTVGEGEGSGNGPVTFKVYRTEVEAEAGDPRAMNQVGMLTNLEPEYWTSGPDANGGGYYLVNSDGESGQMKSATATISLEQNQ